MTDQTRRNRSFTALSTAALLLAFTAAPAAERGKPAPRPTAQDVAQTGSAPATNLQQAVTVLRGAERSAPVTPYVWYGDLRDLPAPVPWKPGDPVKEIPRRFYPEPGAPSAPLPPAPGPDPLLLQQQNNGPTDTTNDFITPSRSFPGQGYTGVNPPDTNGDVGPGYYIQTINTSGGTTVRIWDKALPTPNVVTTFILDSLGSANCASGLGDPVVLYDRLADRWLLSEFSSSGNRLCVYISQTPDPVSGGWFAYNFQAPTFPDYPKYAVWPTDTNLGAGSYVVTANDGGPGVYALDRGNMLAGNAATFQRMSISNLPGFGFETPTAADLDGDVPPPPGAEAVIMRHRDTEAHSGPAAPGDLLEMWLFDVDWVNAANTTLIQQTSIDVAEFDSSLCGLTSFNCFPQPGTGTTLDPLREVIMFRLVYRNDLDSPTLAGNFVTDVDGNNHGGIRWFELHGGNGNWSLYQEGTWAPDGDNRWMGGSALDQSGNFAIGYNVSSSSTFPSLRYTGRLVDDPLGVLTQTESVIHAGTASNASNRYGDYSSMSVDPDDDCTFWFTGEDNTSSTWRTQVASFAFDACGCDLPPSALTITAEVIGDNQVEIGWNDADLATVVQYTIQRSRTPGGPYTAIVTVPDTSPGIAGGPDQFWTDTDVSGGVTYYYLVRASDGDSCKSPASNEASVTATGACTLDPLFSGIQSVTAPSNNNCTLDLAWAPGSPECGGPLAYSVYRSTTPGFTPGAGNLIAAGLTTTIFSDFDQLVDGMTYYYAVRATDTANGSEESNVVIKSGAPHGSSGVCTTVSACADNPYVDVQPDGPLTACQDGQTALVAVPTGGQGTFQYQWTEDGADIPGAHGTFFVPRDAGTHRYNVKIQSPLRPGFVFDGQDTEVTLVNQPTFGGVGSVTNPQGTTCGLDVAWSPASTLCAGPLRYFVYRDTTTPVQPVASNLVAAGVPGTSFHDTSELVNGTTYNYLVRAQDFSTGQTDTNTVVKSAFPDGPGSGPQLALNETFEDAASFANWTVTTGPGIHTCGEWARSNLAADRPSGGSGYYALANNECNPLLGRTSTTLTSPPVNVVYSNLVSVTLDFNMWYNHDGNETGTVQVWDGASWITVWQDTNVDVNAHQAIDVTAWAAQNPAFQVRFDYQDATQDKWFSVDNVKVIALIDVQCGTAPPGPAAVGGLLGSRTSASGDAIGMSWDTTCGASNYNLLWGDLANVSTATLGGAGCSMGTSGTYDWSAVPGGDLYFLVVATDGSGLEGSWGRDSLGAERNGLDASGECAATAKDVSSTCP